MIIGKSKKELDKMRAAGKLVGEVREAIRAMVKPGVTTIDLDRAAEKMIRDAGALQSVAVNYPPASSSLTSGDVTTTGPATLIAVWWGDATGLHHSAVPDNGFSIIENFVDLAHFAWVHDGTLGRRDAPVPPLPDIARVGPELQFRYDPPEMAVDGEAMFGHSRYRMPMPLTVNIEFLMGGGVRRVLWMTASPVTSGSCRSFWFVARSDEREDSHDEAHMAFQYRVLEEDRPVVCNQNPPELPLDGSELSVRTDKVSIEYRRWLRELAAAASEGPEALRAALLLD